MVAEWSMKSSWLLLVLILAWCGCTTPKVIVLSKGEVITRAMVDFRPGAKDGAVRLNLPELNTGTGPRDCYHLFAQYHDGTAVTYGLSITVSSRLADRDAVVLVNGIGSFHPWRPVEAPLLLGKDSRYFEVNFSREFVEHSAVSGRYFTLQSSRGNYEFAVPDLMFRALLEGLEKRLPELRQKSYNVVELMTRDKVQEHYVNEHPDRPEHIKAAILRGEVAEGMSATDLHASLGVPEMVSRGQDGDGAFEIWRYPSGKLMLENGIVTVLRGE